MRVLGFDVRVPEDDLALEPRVQQPVGQGQEYQQDEAEEGQNDPTNQVAFAHVVFDSLTATLVICLVDVLTKYSILDEPLGVRRH